MALRYYLYISDAKVDMLLSQIDPAAKKTLAREFSVSLKVFSAKQSTERAEGEDRVARLEAVARYLQNHDEVGTLDAPGRFFAGEMAMRWGPYAGVAGATGAGSQPVYFGGSNERVILGLGGSSAHLLGSSPGQEQPFSHSATPALLAALASELEDEPPIADAGSAQAADAREALAAVHLATSGLRGPAERLEFLAKRLLVGPSPYPQRDEHEGMQVVLGSPLFVAMLE